jgi:hypothetical protein
MRYVPLHLVAAGLVLGAIAVLVRSILGSGEEWTKKRVIWLICLALFLPIAVLSCDRPVSHEIQQLLPGTQLDLQEGHTDSYDFPIKGGTSEWAAFRTHDEMVAACQVPEPILRELSTEGLIETCLNYPLIGDMGMYSSWQQGFDRVAARFNGLQELLQRPDVGTKLLEHYRQMAPAGIRKKGTSLQKGQYAVTFQYVETLLAQEAVLSSMTAGERRDLLVECLGKVRAKQEPDYNVVDIAYTVWVMGRILVMDTPDGLELEGQTESGLAYFVEEGSFVNEQVMGEILTRAEQYLADG